MKNWKVWILTDKNNTVIAQGRKKDVVNVAYHRYVHELIFSDHLYRTNHNLKEWEENGFIKMLTGYGKISN